MRLHGCNAYVPTTYQVKSILADKSNLSTSKEAVELLEAVEFATNRGRLDWEKDFVNQIVDIFQTHPVSHDFCCFGEDSLFALVFGFGLVSLILTCTLTISFYYNSDLSKRATRHCKGHC